MSKPVHTSVFGAYYNPATLFREEELPWPKYLPFVTILTMPDSGFDAIAEDTPFECDFPSHGTAGYPPGRVDFDSVPVVRWTEPTAYRSDPSVRSARTDTSGPNIVLVWLDDRQFVQGFGWRLTRPQDSRLNLRNHVLAGLGIPTVTSPNLELRAEDLLHMLRLVGSDIGQIGRLLHRLAVTCRWSGNYSRPLAGHSQRSQCNFREVVPQCAHFPLFLCRRSSTLSDREDRLSLRATSLPAAPRGAARQIRPDFTDTFSSVSGSSDLPTYRSTISPSPEGGNDGPKR